MRKQNATVTISENNYIIIVALILGFIIVFYTSSTFHHNSKYRHGSFIIQSLKQVPVYITHFTSIEHLIDIKYLIQQLQLFYPDRKIYVYYKDFDEKIVEQVKQLRDIENLFLLRLQKVTEDVAKQILDKLDKIRVWWPLIIYHALQEHDSVV